jgi:glycosyltransferase involved in cell wall biosynthesis
MTSFPLVSVILPVYNSERYLASAIDSILDQSFKDFELVIIDDGSKDTSLKIIKEYAEKDARVRFFTRENRGLVETLNEAVQYSTGEFIARMDADDISFPQRLEKQLELLSSKSELDVVGCNYFSIDSEGEIRGHTKVPSKAEIPLAILYSVPFAHPSVMAKKTFFEKHKYKESYVEDYLLWVVGYNLVNYDNVNLDLFKYRDNYGNSFSDTKRSLMYKESMKISKKQVKALDVSQFIDYLNGKEARFSYKARSGTTYFLHSSIKVKLTLFGIKPMMTIFVFMPFSFLKFIKSLV